MNIIIIITINRICKVFTVLLLYINIVIEYKNIFINRLEIILNVYNVIIDNSNNEYNTCLEFN